MGPVMVVHQGSRCGPDSLQPLVGMHSFNISCDGERVLRNYLSKAWSASCRMADLSPTTKDKSFEPTGTG